MDGAVLAFAILSSISAIYLASQKSSEKQLAVFLAPLSHLHERLKAWLFLVRGPKIIQDAYARVCDSSFTFTNVYKLTIDRQTEDLSLLMCPRTGTLLYLLRVK